MTEYNYEKEVIIRESISHSDVATPKEQLANRIIDRIKDKCEKGMYITDVKIEHAYDVKFISYNTDAYLDVKCILSGKIYLNNTIITMKIDNIQKTQKGHVVMLSNRYASAVLYRSLKNIKIGDKIPVIINQAIHRGDSITMKIDTPTYWKCPTMGLTGEVIEFSPEEFNRYDKLIADERKAAQKSLVEYVDKLLNIKDFKFKVDISGDSMSETGFLSGFKNIKADNITRTIGRLEALEFVRGVYKIRVESYISLLHSDIKTIGEIWRET